MDTEDFTMEEKCENLMNIVVESRKRFGKMCVDYDHKTSLMENKILNLQIETISNYRFKVKSTVPPIDVEDMCKDSEDFAVEIIERKKKMDALRNKVRDTQEVILQLKSDNVAKKMHCPLTAEVMLAQANEKLK